MNQIVAPGATIPGFTAVWALSLPLGDNWPLLVFGVLVGMAAKAVITLEGAGAYTRRDLLLDALMFFLIFSVAGLVVEGYATMAAKPLSGYGQVVLAAGLAIGGKRVRWLVEMMAMARASAALKINGITGDVVLPPAAEPVPPLPSLENVK